MEPSYYVMMWPDVERGMWVIGLQGDDGVVRTTEARRNSTLLLWPLTGRVPADTVMLDGYGRRVS